MDSTYSRALPKVTIAIPTLNRAEYLRFALESALNQTYGNVEVVVSNNASTDATSAYLNSCSDTRLRVLSQTRMLTMTENWNACLDAARGEYFLLLSDDDLLEPDAIADLVAEYSRCDGLSAPGVVYGSGCFIDSAGNIVKIFKQAPQREAGRDFILAFLAGARDLWFCAVLLRTEDIRPGFPTAFKVACDAAVWMRIAMRQGSVSFVPKPIARYRVHQNLTFSTPLDVWRADRKLLRELVIDEDNHAGRPDPDFTQHFHATMQRSELGMMIGWINMSFRHSKLRALLTYSHYLPDFFRQPSGPLFLGKGLLTLFLGERAKLWLRQRLKKEHPVQSSSKRGAPPRPEVN